MKLAFWDYIMLTFLVFVLIMALLSVGLAFVMEWGGL